MLKRLGSELLSDSDKLLPHNDRIQLQQDCLPFSNGRAALAWLCGKYGFKSAVICAYCCPSVPAFFRRRGIGVDMFDVSQSPKKIMALAREAEPPVLIFIPALFGLKPTALINISYDTWVGDLVIIDAMQTAFGHEDFTGAVLSGPRKTTGLTDGAILRLPGAYGWRSEVDGLTPADLAIVRRGTAQHHWAEGNEAAALTWSKSAELAIPETTHRMSRESLSRLDRLDRAWHASKRRTNARRLVLQIPGSLLSQHLSVWLSDQTTPYSLPILVANPDEVLRHLHSHRIFATRLWPDSEHAPERHPISHQFCGHLVSLPVDQRHDEADMDRVATAVMEIAKPMEQ